MDSLVDLEVLRPGEHLPTAGERAGERLLSCVYPNVVDQLVLGLEGTTLPGAVVPEAGVVGDLRASDVLHCQVGHDLVEGAEDLIAGLLGHGLIRVDPQAGHLLLDGLPHVPEEGAGRVVRRHAHSVHVRRGGVHLRAGGGAHVLPGGPVRGRHAGQAGSGHALHGVVQAGKRIGEHGGVRSVRGLVVPPQEEVPRVRALSGRGGGQVAVLASRSGVAGRGRGGGGRGRGRGRGRRRAARLHGVRRRELQRAAGRGHRGRGGGALNVGPEHGAAAHNSLQIASSNSLLPRAS